MRRATLEAARAGFPEFVPETEKESVHIALVAANLLLQHIREQVPYDEDDVEFHDLRKLHSTVRRAQEFTR